MKILNIGFIGNFIPAHSTENDRKWSFEKLGHKVITFQENETSAKDLLDIANNLDVLFYSHTHDPSYEIFGLKELFQVYKERGIPTVSVHLDRWAWLKRVEDMGNEATWFTEYIFMADGSPEAVKLYEKLNLNWFWLKPAVIERDCYIVEPDLIKYPHEIVFTGSKGYHPEYQFRPQLIEFLQKTYGDKFGHYGNDGIGKCAIRGHELNVLYSTAKIVVGDSCFGSRPYYVSDRYYEVRGRGGFLLHPKVENIDTYGVASYKVGSLTDLKKAIDYFLKNTLEREILREKGYDWVKNNETHTHRAKEMLNVIFNNKKKEKLKQFVKKSII